MTLPDAEVGWGIVGPGNIARQFAAGMTQIADGRILAVASRSLARADDFGDEFGIPHRYDSTADLASDPTVDIVYIATPNSQHEPDTIQMLEAGKHVLCEKPFALSRRGAARMIDAAKGSGTFLMEAMWSRFLPSYRKLGELLNEEAIGQILLVDADFGFRIGPDPAPYLARRLDLALGGGALLDLGIYPVQLALTVLGPTERIAAEASLSPSGVDDLVVITMAHQAGGVSNLRASFSCTLPCEARIYGTEGMIELPAFMHCPDHLVLTRGSSVERFDTPIDGEGLHYQVIEVHERLRGGAVESFTMPLDDTLLVAETLDEVLSRVGVHYPSGEHRISRLQ